MHRLATSFVLGFHGCDRAVAEKLIQGIPFQPSENDYDWLGHGAYFWESNPLRGLEFAKELRSKRHPIADPYVVGAVIDLGYCLDLLSSSGTELVEKSYQSFRDISEKAGKRMPMNTGGEDLLLRKLDCAVINYIHESALQKNLPGFDTVRGVFIEGGRVYENSGFYRKTHIQICVRNARCIKGVFRLPDEDLADLGLS